MAGNQPCHFASPHQFSCVPPGSRRSSHSIKLPYRIGKCLLSLQGTNYVPGVAGSLQDLQLRSEGNANLTTLQPLPVTALDITILRLSRANCLCWQVASAAVMKNNAKKTPQASAFLIFCTKKQLPTAAWKAHIIRAGAHKNSEVNGGVRPDRKSVV